MAVTIADIKNKIEELDKIIGKVDLRSQGNFKTVLLQFVILSRNRLNSQYNVFLDDSQISSLYSNIANLISCLTSYSKSAVYVYISNAVTCFKNSLSIINLIPGILEAGTEQAVEDIISDFRRRSEDIISEIEKNGVSVKSLQEKLTSLEELLKDKNVELAGIASKFQSEFLSAQQKRAEAFENEFGQLKTSFEESAKESLEKIKETERKVSEIYELVGKTAVTGSQRVYADKARVFANISLWGGISLMIITIIYGVYPVLKTVRQADILDLKLLFNRIFTSFVLLLPSFYLLNESHRQRETENKYREMEIKLAAVEPYFKNIDSGKSKEEQSISDRDLTKLELAKRLLSPSENVNKGGMIAYKDIFGCFERILKRIFKFISRTGR